MVNDGRSLDGTSEHARPASIIEIDSITKKYGQHDALHEMSLAIQKGEFLSLLGPSGCGKTTLLRIIAGFLGPTSGDVRIEGRSMHNVPPNKRPVNTVFQNYALFPHMTVAENIAFGPRRQGRPKDTIAADVKRVLGMVGMVGYEERYPHELSGGQQQRVALARAIINQPRVLLLDEPLGALDLKLRKRMQFELKRLHGELGITFIYVTHDQEEALAMSDRIAVMRQGRIVQLGSGEEIYQRPNSSYVADFIGEANLIACARASGGGFQLPGNDAPLPLEGPDAPVAKLMIRPEDITFGAGNEMPGSIGTTVTIVQKVFLGHWWRFSAMLADGQEIVICPRDNTASVPDIGAQVPVRWAQQAARILEE